MPLKSAIGVLVAPPRLRVGEKAGCLALDRARSEKRGAAADCRHSCGPENPTTRDA
jgi:hypothetical protein